jgi:glutaminyl-tRNA synthetase
LWIEEDDFALNPPPKYYRLYVGNSVRLRYGYIVTCTGVEQDADGRVTAVRCTYDETTAGGNAPDNRKVRGTIHWVDAATAVPLEVRLYDYLFACERPMEAPEGGTFMDNLTPNSCEVITTAYGEASLAGAVAGDIFQFERLGYYACDTDSTPERLVFNKTTGLRDTWAKVQKKGAKGV